ncbi:PaaI family thioesterase [Novosphingobium sp. KCTC 2891]|uniref:PaaI family thioesterase n=1 Tax=Novosphingobium sp. KCTC 2891 TaxID=2989730 RepID=UPI002221FDE9|nr:PaaI family thioesterase [Novosphingobium sp. KCTC 2891]MCW1384820.1 PaaI family thioesterase [Novosphingobium sp. KCTC 2891]
MSGAGGGTGAGFVPVMDVAALQTFLLGAFPAEAHGRIGRVTQIAPGLARMTLEPGEDSLRPGDLVSGPTQMGLVDVAAYAVVLAHIGPQPMAVTSSLTMNFLRGARRAPVHAEAALLKLGRRLATIDVRLWQDDPASLVAQATAIYALPA